MKFEPIPNDPESGLIAQNMADIRDAKWNLTTAGDYGTFALSAFKNDGSNYQEVVAVQCSTRINGTDELETVRLLISPEDAVGLAKVLMHTGVWLLKSQMERGMR